MSEVEMDLKEIYDLAKKVLLLYGCDEENAETVAITVSTADRNANLKLII